MVSSSRFAYRFKTYELGVYIELYLPKKSHFQGTLYETLTKGFDIDYIRQHLLDAGKRQRIYELLEEYTELNRYSDDRVAAMQPVLSGYSLYEVDGVFCSRPQGANQKLSIIEERTQIIRMMFLPDIDYITHNLGINNMAYKDIREIIWKLLVDFDRSDIQISADGSTEKIISYLKHWKDDIGLTLLGYIVFEICSKIISLRDNLEADYEEEIWLTSFWELNVNRINLLKASENIFNISGD